MLVFFLYFTLQAPTHTHMLRGMNYVRVWRLYRSALITEMWKTWNQRTRMRFAPFEAIVERTAKVVMYTEAIYANITETRDDLVADSIQKYNTYLDILCREFKFDYQHWVHLAPG